jgi:hypothetical protein
VGERSWKNVLFLFSTLRLRKSVLRLAVRGNRISDRVVFSQGGRCLRASIAVDRKSMRHTVGERSWKNVVYCVFSVAVMEKCFEACGYGEWHLRSGFMALRGVGV